MTTRINVASIAIAHGPRGVARIGRHAPLSETSDAFGALAPLFRVRPELQVLCRFGAQWASPHDPEPAGWMPFHMVVAGHCHLGIAGDPPLVLHAGDVVLLPFGDAHTVMGSNPAPRAASPPIRTQSHGAIAIKSNVEAPEVELVCGRLAFEQAHGNLARAALPRVIHVKTAGDPAGARLSTLLLAIRDELSEARAGAAPICRDLASALFLIVLRSHFETHPVRAGLLRLLESRQASRAVAAMLAQPARAWTLDEIAATAQTSRATLVRDFRRLSQATPFDILAYLRLGLARHQLATSRRPIAEIAIEVGYQSQSAFSRAFQRRFDMSPSEVRQKL